MTNTPPISLDSLTFIDKEDGELSDEEADYELLDVAEDQPNEITATPQPIVVIEREIDRIIQEVEEEELTLRAEAAKPPKMIPLERIESPSVSPSLPVVTVAVQPDSEDHEQLRLAALVSMKNGLEEGELREEVATNDQQTPKTSEPRSRVKYRLSMDSKREKSPFRKSRYESRRPHRTRTRSESRVRKRRSRRSESRERRRTKRKEDPPLMQSAPAAINEQPHQLLESMSNKGKPIGREISENIIFGEPTTSQPDQETVQQPDNHELVSMEVETEPEDNLMSPNPKRQCHTMEDDAILRKILMEQLSKRQDTPPAKQNAPNIDQYTKLKKEFKEATKIMENCEEKAIELEKKKINLLRELEKTIGDIEMYNSKMWAARDKIHELRPQLDNLQVEDWLKRNVNNTTTSVYKLLEDHNTRMTEMTKYVQGRMTVSSVPNSPMNYYYQGPQDMDLSVTPVSNHEIPQEEEFVPPQKEQSTALNEEALREILLAKQRAQHGQMELISSAKKTKKSDGPPSLLDVPQKKTSFKSWAPKSPQSSLPSVSREELTRDKVTQIIRTSKFPLRLFQHAGLDLPKYFEIDLELCKWELSGKCKDVDCVYRHLQDDKLLLREVISMILWHAPHLAGKYEREVHSSQVDHLLSLQNYAEERSIFLRRILRPLVASSEILDTPLYRINHETGKIDLCIN